MRVMLVMNVPPELEDDMVDYLLSLDVVSGFTSYNVRGHGEHSDMSVAEQVAGRRKRVQFETMIFDSDIDKVINNLRQEVGVGINYWHYTISDMGRTR